MEDDPFFVGAIEADAPQEVSEGSKPAESGGVPVEELVPPMILKAIDQHPHLSAAVFGYDIRQMAERPWSKPSAVTSDYFNYGFDERSWRIYCAMQAEGRSALVEKAETFYETIEGIASAAAAQRVQDDIAQSGVGNGMMPLPPMMFAPPGGMPQGGMMQIGVGNNQRSQNEGFFKTKLCQRYQEGRCTRGSTCNYAHGAHELRLAPSNRMHSGGPPQGGDMQQMMPMQSYGGPGGENGGILSMPPPINASLGLPMYPMPPQGMPPQFQMPPPPGTGFRMPQKRERSSERDGGVFEQVLQ